MSEKICKNCKYYEPDYGTFCANGWSRNGDTGNCLLEPKKIYTEGKRIGCRYWEGR